MDYEALRQWLLAERRRLQLELDELNAELSESLQESSQENPYDQHMAETATATLEREIDLSLEENTIATIHQIDRALEKLDKGTYGLCEHCGRPIGDDRLRVAPFATLCIDCKRLEERER